MTTVVTGASGHIGANLVRSLLAKGRPVRALIHRNTQAIEGLNVEIVQGDICDQASLYDAFNGADVVYHLAAHISILTDESPLLELVNGIGTRNVVEACLYCGVRRLIHFSSIHALVQKPLDVPVDESRPLVESGDCTHYDLSKAAGEQEIRQGIENGLDAIILNPTAIVGPYDYEPSLFGEALLALAHGRLPVLITGGYNWVDVRDVVEGAVRAEERAPAGARYLLSGEWVSLSDVASIVAQITGAPAPSFVCPVWLGRLAAPIITVCHRRKGKRALYTSASIKALQSNRNISHEKASRDLDYYPRPFRETITDTLRWFEANGRLKHPLIPDSTESR
jgi:dihydroflavonol-4-reductase